MQIDSPKYVLAIDCETSGLAGRSLDPSRNLDNPSEFYQAVAWGVVVLDFETFQPVELYKCFIKPVEGVTWSTRAEQVHGLSREWLAENGIDEEQAVVEIAELIVKYWGTSTPVIALGHNPFFDVAFMRSMFARHGVSVRFSNRLIDTNSLLMVLLNLTGSDAMFDYFEFPPRDKHDPLDDILMTIISASEFRKRYRAAQQSLS